MSLTHKYINSIQDILPFKWALEPDTLFKILHKNSLGLKVFFLKAFMQVIYMKSYILFSDIGKDKNIILYYF
jgi:hypothetical protein